MKLLTFKISKSGPETLGILHQDEKRIYPLRQFGLTYETMTELIEHITDDEYEMLKRESTLDSNSYIALKSVILCAPIPIPKQDIICLGLNFKEHAEESAKYKKEIFESERNHPVYFSKRVTEAIGDGAIIPNHNNIVDSLDYEVELAVIIGKDAKNVDTDDALNYVFGYTIMNDVSARNLQTAHKQWFFGKSLDGFTPMGPFIVTADEFEGPPSLSIRSRVNGELRQNSSTDLFIFDIGYVVHELSQGMTLKAGTIISMGTPAGVGMGFTPPKFLTSGDVVECEIERIGVLSNIVG